MDSWKVISDEIIKPSSRTLPNLRHYELSYLDQLSPKVYNPLVFFYEIDNPKFTDTLDEIKMYLSKALALFYPLAGRVVDDRFVDCNDEGAHLSVAEIDIPFDLFVTIKKPNPSEVLKLLPFELHKLNEFILGVRVNVFKPGGIAIGICVSHQLADALSSINFVKTWSALSLSRGNLEAAKKPVFVSTMLFPPTNKPWFDPSSEITTEVVSKRFTFEKSKIEEIRARYGKAVNPNPSRVEALSAFILSRYAEATKYKGSEEERVFLAVHPVNIRPRLDPKQPENSFGNLYRCALTILRKGEQGDEMVRRVREEIKKVDKEFLKEVREYKEDEKIKSLIEEATRLAEKGSQLITFGFTSLCKFPLYDTDFGFGQPLWVSSATLSFNNLVGFMDAKNGVDIEAYIGLKMEDMAKLEADQEFLQYASV